jgi:hypothetical protein
VRLPHAREPEPAGVVDGRGRFLRQGALAAALVLVRSGPDPGGTGSAAWYSWGVARAEARTHEAVLRQLRPARQPALRQAAAAVGLTYPPRSLSLVGLKQERVLEVWAPGESGWRRLRAYPILAASGGPGPKLRQGDMQVPEGSYRLTTFNPNSSYHLSLRFDYPNAEDRAAARQDGRARRGTDLGGDIYIHGRSVSIGCLAIGDAAIEELYVLLADVGLAHARVLLAPSADPQAQPGAPAWLPARYERLRRELLAVRSGRP